MVEVKVLMKRLSARKGIKHYQLVKKNQINIFSRTTNFIHPPNVSVMLSC